MFALRSLARRSLTKRLHLKHLWVTKKDVSKRHISHLPTHYPTVFDDFKKSEEKVKTWVRSLAESKTVWKAKPPEWHLSLNESKQEEAFHEHSIEMNAVDRLKQFVHKPYRPSTLLELLQSATFPQKQFVYAGIPFNHDVYHVQKENKAIAPSEMWVDPASQQVLALVSSVAYSLNSTSEVCKEEQLYQWKPTMRVSTMHTPSMPTTDVKNLMKLWSEGTTEERMKSYSNILTAYDTTLAENGSRIDIGLRSFSKFDSAIGIQKSNGVSFCYDTDGFTKYGVYHLLTQCWFPNHQVVLKYHLQLRRPKTEDAQELLLKFRNNLNYFNCQNVPVAFFAWKK